MAVVDPHPLVEGRDLTVVGRITHAEECSPILILISHHAEVVRPMCRAASVQGVLHACTKLIAMVERSQGLLERDLRENVGVPERPGQIG